MVPLSCSGNVLNTTRFLDHLGASLDRIIEVISIPIIEVRTRCPQRESPSEARTRSMISGKFNVVTFFAFLKGLRHSSIRTGRRVVVITDNARYHHARLHKEWRASHDEGFVLDYLPPYSPELNPIERVWKLTRRQCLHNRYFPVLEEVVAVVETQFENWRNGNETLRRLCAIT